MSNEPMDYESAYTSLVAERHRLVEELGRMRPVYEAALWCGRATHTNDANCAAGDHNDCEFREARRALNLAVHEALKPADHEERKMAALAEAIAKEQE